MKKVSSVKITKKENWVRLDAEALDVKIDSLSQQNNAKET